MRGDRIEHGAVIPRELDHTLRTMGLAVVTQPNFVSERGDEYLTSVDAADLDDLWRCASLLDAGVTVGAGSDAPFGRPDPWALIQSAVDRRTDYGCGAESDRARATCASVGTTARPARVAGRTEPAGGHG